MPDLEKATQGLARALAADLGAVLALQGVLVAAMNLAVVVAQTGLDAARDHAVLALAAPDLVDLVSVVLASAAPVVVAPVLVLTVSALQGLVPPWVDQVILRDHPLDLATDLDPATGLDTHQKHPNRWSTKPWSSTVIPTANWIAKNSSL